MAAAQLAALQNLHHESSKSSNEEDKLTENDASEDGNFYVYRLIN